MVNVRNASIKLHYLPQQAQTIESIRAYTSGSVAENSGSTWQGAKISASADILAPTELYLVHNSINTTSG